jgi:hypothetical protein
LVVVEVVPGLELSVSMIGAGPVLGVGPFLERGLDEAFGLAVGGWPRSEMSHKGGGWPRSD